jgi:hypothetical protein
MLPSKAVPSPPAPKIIPEVINEYIDDFAHADMHLSAVRKRLHGPH